MASTLLAVRLLAVLLLGIKCVFGNACDCETVKDILTDEIFDLKAENKQLESRIEKMELMMQSKTPISYQSGKIGTDRIEMMETRISAIETRIPESTKYPKNPFQLQNLIVKALRSEKVERRKSELKIAAGLRKINDSLKAFNVQTDAVFGSHFANISNRILDIKMELSQNFSVVRNEVTAVSNYTEKMANQANSLIENKIKTIEMSIDATKHDVSTLRADLKTVIDIVLLDQVATCKPNCAYGGVCFRDNTCKCKPFTEGPRCGKVICDDKCYENGGRCVGPRKCECPENRHGPNCEQYYCIVPDEIDQRLSIFDRKRVTISSGSLVENGYFVFFNCSDVDELGYEPLNRQFKCHNGLWVESERDRNWKLGNNGAFPACRKAVCEPECLHGGVCFKDDNCRCKEFLEGRRCEKVICEDKCYENGGECIGPGICKCPEEQSGPNCELKSVYYLISVKTGKIYFHGVGTDARVYITLHGQKGKTDRIYLMGSFERDDVDETRIEAKDIRPITSVVIGHDGSDWRPDWYLEYVSIYVENMEEYYVFKHNDWVRAERDVRLHRQGLDEQKCIDSFDSGHKWWPKWSAIGSKDRYVISRGRRMSLRGCKQACINLQDMQCIAVMYSNDRKMCSGFAVSDTSYFTERHGTWKSPVYLRKCKQFD